MPKEQALEIIRLWQENKSLLQQCLDKYQQDKLDEMLGVLRQAGVRAEPADLVLALDAFWVISKLPVRSSAPASNGEFDLRLELQKGLAAVVRQIDRGYERAMTMYTVAFYLGVAMVLASIVAALVLNSEKATLVLGGLGMADVIASLVFRPAQDLQNSRGNLAQLQAAFFSWFNDIYNWNNYLLLLDREATTKNQLPAFDRIREISEAQMRNVEQMMRLVEQYCEMYQRPALIRKSGRKKIKNEADIESQQPTPAKSTP